MKWRFMDTGYRRGLYNMHLDDHLANQLCGGMSLPTLRVYCWNPCAISLGFHQHETDIDRERCRREGVDVIRRPTGGRAVFHGHELTYSVVMASEGRSIAETHEWIGRGLVGGLLEMGVQAEMAGRDSGVVDIHSHDRSISCFASTTQAEIQYDGRKLVGSAQRRYRSQVSPTDSILMQHGSVLLGQDHRRLCDYVSPSSPNFRDNIKEIMEKKTTDVETILGRPVTFEEAAAAIRKGFASALGIEFVEEEVLLYDQTFSGYS